MGIAKYYEDNELKICERIFERDHVFESERLIRTYFDCYYCNQDFESSELRNLHIKRNHNVAGPLLFINGKITTEECFVENVESAKILMCGFTNVDICIDDNKIDTSESEINLLAFFQNFDNFVNIKIGQKLFKISRFTQENISNKSIEKVLTKWEEQINANETLDPQGSNYPKSLNNAEIRYLNGFFNYYTACRLNINAEDKKNRYKDAYALLTSFNSLTPKARIVLKVIAFRLNWFDSLNALTKQSNGTFNYVLDFFNGRKSTFKEQDSRKNEQEIFVEQEVEEYINAIIDYQNNNKCEVEKFLSNWSDYQIERINDSNKKDRLMFLKARQCFNNGEIEKSKIYFSRILSPYLKTMIKNNKY
jgi:hypothetical protein